MKIKIFQTQNLQIREKITQLLRSSKFHEFQDNDKKGGFIDMLYYYKYNNAKKKKSTWS